MLRSFFTARQSIRSKIFLAFSCLTALSLIAVSTVMYLYMSGDATRNATNFASDNLRHSNEVMQMILEDVDRINTVVIANSGAVNAIDALRSDSPEPSYEWFQEQKAVTGFLANLIAYKSPIVSIALIGLDGKMFASGIPEWVEKRRLDDGLIRTIAESGSNRVYTLLHKDGEPDTLAVGRAIRYNNKPIGAVVTELDYRQMERIYRSDSTPGIANYVIDQDGRFIVNDNPQLTADSANGTFLSGPLSRLDRPNQSGGIKIGGEPYLTVGSRMSYTGWTALSVIPKRTLLPRFNELRLRMAETAIAVFLAVMLVSMAVSAGITKNLQRLLQVIQHVKQGRMTIRTSIDSRDEVGHLYRAFAAMVEQLKALMNDIKLGERQKREAELQALQAQVSPHFLYNTLNTIKYLARLRHATNIEEMVGSLIELLRAVLGNTKEFVTLREELDYVQAYLNIQKYRYSNRIEVQYRIDPELYGCGLPKMIVQPIVENAIIHGLGPLRGGGSINIEAYENNRCLIVSVTDSGIGMDEAQIRRVLGDAGPVGAGRSSFSGIGIGNVRERIRMTCGLEGNVEISSETGSYTRVELRIPMSDKGGNVHDARAVGG